MSNSVINSHKRIADSDSVFKGAHKLQPSDFDDGRYGLSSSLENSDDVDMWRVHLTSGEILTVDTDTLYFPETGQHFGPNTVLALFDNKGNLLTFNDDTPLQPVGAPLDSLITYTAAESGNYYIAVSAYANIPIGTGGFNDGPDYSGGGRFGGDYDLNILIA